MELSMNAFLNKKRRQNKKNTLKTFITSMVYSAAYRCHRVAYNYNESSADTVHLLIMSCRRSYWLLNYLHDY